MHNVCPFPKLRKSNVASLNMNLAEDNAGDFKAGDRVRVSHDSITLFVLKDYPDGYSVPKGLEGEVIKVITVDPKSGKLVSPNRPILVKFESPKFQAHFESRELDKM